MVGPVWHVFAVVRWQMTLRVGSVAVGGYVSTAVLSGLIGAADHVLVGWAMALEAGGLGGVGRLVELGVECGDGCVLVGGEHDPRVS